MTSPYLIPLLPVIVVNKNNNSMTLTYLTIGRYSRKRREKRITSLRKATVIKVPYCRFTIFMGPKHNDPLIRFSQGTTTKVKSGILNIVKRRGRV